MLCPKINCKFFFWVDMYQINATFLSQIYDLFKNQEYIDLLHCNNFSSKTWSLYSFGKCLLAYAIILKWGPFTTTEVILLPTVIKRKGVKQKDIIHINVWLSLINQSKDWDLKEKAEVFVRNGKSVEKYHKEFS